MAEDSARKRGPSPVANGEPAPANGGSPTFGIKGASPHAKGGIRTLQTGANMGAVTGSFASPSSLSRQSMTPESATAASIQPPTQSTQAAASGAVGPMREI